MVQGAGDNEKKEKERHHGAKKESIQGIPIIQEITGYDFINRH